MEDFRKCCIAISLCCLTATMNAKMMENEPQDNVVSISHLSNTHALTHIATSHRYLLLPVEENAEIAHIAVINNGTEVQALNVRLAVNKIDYFVPLDLSYYKGKDILLNITLRGDRTRYIEEKYYVCWKNMTYSDTFDTTNKEKFRPLIHHTPLYGWMNDPNGMVYKDGEYHLFYQYNPYGSQWENMTWGHSVSKDLVHWNHLDNAISPDAIGTIFSGSCVVDKNNTAGFGKDAMVAIYTAAGDDQTQCLAYSNDNGKTFTKYAGNPILTSDVRDFRDPKVFWNEDIHKWNLVLAAGQEMRFYTSDNLKEWTYESCFGKEYGDHGGVWECPDLMQLPVEGKSEKKWVLICNINPGGPFGGSATQYFTGTFDGHQFTCDSKPEMTKWADYGKDHYAAVTFSNAPEGRHIMLAWMSNWQYAGNVPTKQYRSGNSIARDISLYEDNGEEYIKVIPAKEMEANRNKVLLQTKDMSLDKKSITKKIAKNDGAFEIVIDFTATTCNQLSFTLANEKGEKVMMTYDSIKKTFSMDRTNSGDITFSKDFAVTTTAPVKTDGDMRLRLFVDKSSIEAFDGNGRFAMSNLVFPSLPYNNLTLSSAGKSKINSLVIYNLK